MLRETGQRGGEVPRRGRAALDGLPPAVHLRPRHQQARLPGLLRRPHQPGPTGAHPALGRAAGLGDPRLRRRRHAGRRHRQPQGRQAGVQLRHRRLPHLQRDRPPDRQGPGQGGPAGPSLTRPVPDLKFPFRPSTSSWAWGHAGSFRVGAQAQPDRRPLGLLPGGLQGPGQGRAGDGLPRRPQGLSKRAAAAGPPFPPVAAA
ncbi:unnamed protein product, partial [Heterosigma akashiwo]